jgi:RNA polymerase sigma-70 factor (ECF subfamily)
MIFWIAAWGGSAGGQEAPAHEAHIRECVRRVLAGERDAFDEIVFLYRDEMYGVAWRLTRNADDALDVLQEIFLRTFRALGSFRGRSSFSTWLHRIAVTTAMDYLRRERRHYGQRVYESAGDDEDDAGSRPLEHATGEAPPPDQAAKAEIRRALHEALARLSRRQREVIILHYFHELPLPQVAEVLRCSVGSVKCHLFRAQVRLRALLKDFDTDAP